MKPKLQGIVWVLVADAGQARIFRAEAADAALTEVVGFQEHGRQYPDEAGYSDRPGRVQESANAARHGMEPRTDDHVLRARRFARELADFLVKSLRAGQFAHLIIAAPHRFAGLLDEAMHPDLAARVVHREPKDLVHESATMLHRRLMERE